MCPKKEALKSYLFEVFRGLGPRVPQGGPKDPPRHPPRSICLQTGTKMVPRNGISLMFELILMCLVCLVLPSLVCIVLSILSVVLCLST